MNPTVRKLIAGRDVARLRELARKTQSDGAALIGGRQSKVAEQESGIRAISRDEMTKYLDGYGVQDPAERDRLLDLTEGTNQYGRWTGHRRVHPNPFRPYLDLEEAADRLRIMGSELIPGLVQHPRFVQELHVPEEGHTDVAPGTSISDHVSARLARQRIIERGTDVHVVLSESAVRRTHGVSADAMLAQVEHLITLSRMPNVTIQVLPFTARTKSPEAVALRYTLLRIPSSGLAGPLEVAYTEGADEYRYLDVPAVVDAHASLFQRLSAEALGAEDTRAMLRRVGTQF